MSVDVHDLFVYLPAAMALDERLSKTHLRVLIALYSFRRKNTATAWPSRDKLAQRCGLAPGKISTATTELARLGWLHKSGDGGRGRSCEYRLLVPDLAASNGADAVTVAAPATVAPAVTTTVPTVATPTVPTVARGKEHASEHAVEQDSAARCAAATAALPANVTPAVWQGWVQHRSQLGKRLTPATVQAQLAMLAAQGAQADAVLQQSIRNGWQGLFALKTAPASKPSYDDGQRRDYGAGGRL